MLGLRFSRVVRNALPRGPAQKENQTKNQAAGGIQASCSHLSVAGARSRRVRVVHGLGGGEGLSMSGRCWGCGSLA